MSFKATRYLGKLERVTERGSASTIEALSLTARAMMMKAQYLSPVPLR